jgi:hypothetical protein
MPNPRRHPRNVYDDQQGIARRIRAYLTENHFSINPSISEAYVFGSILDNQFGWYDKPTHPGTDREKRGSDIDLLVVLNPAAENIGTYADRWVRQRDFMFPYYHVCLLNGIDGIKDNIHLVTALAYDPSKAGQIPQIPEKVDRETHLQGKSLEEIFRWNMGFVNPILWYNSHSS